MNFSLVFYLLEDEEVPAFLESAYSITRGFLQSKFQFQVRVGALYLLYALYSQQPLNGTNRIKIKFTPEMWTEFVDLIVEVKEQEHHDTNFIFYQLYASKAFHLVAHPEIVIMNKERNKINTTASSQLRESISLDNYLDPNLLRGLEEIHRKYQAVKSDLTNSLNGNESILVTNQLHMSNSNLLSDVATQFTQFSEILESNENETTSSQSQSKESEPLVSDQKAVKLRAMSTQVSAPRHFHSVIKDEPPEQQSCNQVTSESLPVVEESAVEKQNKTLTNTNDAALSNDLFAEANRDHSKFNLTSNYSKRTRIIMSNAISNDNFFDGAIALQSSGTSELPYVKNVLTKDILKKSADKQ